MIVLYLLPLVLMRKQVGVWCWVFPSDFPKRLSTGQPRLSLNIPLLNLNRKRTLHQRQGFYRKNLRCLATRRCCRRRISGLRAYPLSGCSAGKGASSLCRTWWQRRSQSLQPIQRSAFDRGIQKLFTSIRKLIAPCGQESAQSMQPRQSSYPASVGSDGMF